MNALTLLNSHARELRDLGARRIGVFGSYARGDAKSDSDVDIYIEFEPEQRTYSEGRRMGDTDVMFAPYGVRRQSEAATALWF